MQSHLAPPATPPDEATAALPRAVVGSNEGAVRGVPLFGRHLRIAEPATFAGAYGAGILIGTLLHRDGSGPAWWGVFTLIAAALAVLTARFYRAIHASPQSGPGVLINVVLFAVAMAGALWCSREAYLPLLMFAVFAYAFILFTARTHTARGLVLATAAMYVALPAVTWWAQLTLAPPRHPHWDDLLIVLWPLGLAAMVGHRTTRTVQAQLALQRTAADLALRDALTGLANRTAFLLAAERAVAAAAVGGPACSVMLLDLDGLKDINDSFGHATGDAALRRMGNAIDTRLQRGELVARLGGDEFAILAFHPRGHDAASVAGRFAPAMEATVLDDAAAGHTILLSASWGMATAGPDGATIAELLARADERLLQHKSTPRTAGVISHANDHAYIPLGRRTLAEALGALMDAARDVAGSGDTDQFLRRTASRAAELIGARTAAITVMRGENRHGFRVWRDAAGDHFTVFTLSPKSGIIRHVEATGDPYVSNDLAGDPVANREHANEAGISSALCVPLRGGEARPHGALLLSDKRGGAPFTEHDVRVAQAFADLAGTALAQTEALAAARGAAQATEAALCEALDALARTRMLG